MTRLYLPEAIDSRLFSLDNISSDLAEETLVRLRLHIAPRLLLGDRIFVPEGWSLDSLPHLIVQAEILTAFENLRSGDLRRHSGGFAPFVYEVRKSGTHNQTFLRYLARSDCEWSGFPILREDRDKTRRLAEILSQLESADHLHRSDDVRHAFSSALGNELIADALAASYAYALGPVPGRRTPPTPVRTSLAQHLRRDVPLLLRNLGNDGTSSERAQEGYRLLAALDDAAIVSSASSVIAFARSQLDNLARPLEYIVRAAYMRLASEGSHAAFTAPHRGETGFGDMSLEDQILRQQGTSAEIEFSGAIDSSDPAFPLLSRQMNWIPIWEDILRLANRGEWKSLVAEFRADLARSIRLARIDRMPSFRKMEQMLASDCPDLAMVTTPGGRIGLSVTVSRWIENIAIGAAVTAPALLLSPAVATGAGVALGAVIAEAIGSESFRPLSGRKHIRSTLFRLFG